MRRAQAAVAAAAVVLALACAALMVEAGRRIFETLGPSHALAAADGSLYVVSHGHLHVFAPDGKRREVVDLAALGVPVKPPDIALHADGRIVFTDADASVLHRCRLPAGPCETIDPGLNRSGAQPVLPLNSLKIALDDASERYYIADNAGHRLVITDFAGHVLDRSPPGAVRHPNHLYLRAPGELTVVDTDRHRIATYDVHGDRFGSQLDEVAADEGEYSRPGRRLPFDSVPLPDGKTAVLIADWGMKDADLVILGANGLPAGRIDLGADSDPYDVELWGDRLVVSDPARYELEAVSLDASAVRDFPPADFKAELDRERARVKGWRATQLGARLGLIAVPLLAILVLWRLGGRLAPAERRVPAPSTPERSAPQGGATPWISYDADFLERERRRLALTAWVGVPLTLVAIALLGLIFARMRFSASAFVRFGPSLALFATIPFLVAYAMREVRRRRASFRMMATDAGLQVEAPGRGDAVAETFHPWSEVWTDGFRLAAGRHFVVLSQPSLGIDLFDRHATESQVLARIPEPNRISAMALTLRVMRARPGQSAALALLLVALIALLALRLRLL